MSVDPGDRVEIVMDVVHVTDDRGERERVLVQGVFPFGGPYPPPVPGAHRNITGVFYGSNMGGVPAFLIRAPDAEAEPE